MNIDHINSLLPDGHFAVFRPAADESTDDEFGVYGPDEKDTGVSVQVGDGCFAATRWDAKAETAYHWMPREVDETEALERDIANALADE